MSAHEPFGESRGVGLTNWMVRKAAGLLERKASRRGFILGSAMVGSAVAVAGCTPGTTPGTPYKHITDCSSGLCTDGYTDFCCTVNNGVNACPPNSFAGGWWRADYSSFCNGTRYYIDCMQNCCGPSIGGGFCAGCTECRCAGGCDTRRVYCNYFRYGQCHQEIAISGPIACRVVTCTPPYNDASMACSTAAAVDNSTAEHTSACPTTPPPPPLPLTGTAASPTPGQVAVFYRAYSGKITVRSSNGTSWSSASEIGPNVTSALTSATDATGMYVFGRGFGDALWWNRYSGGSWSGQQVFGGVPLTSDPIAVTAPNAIYLFARSENGALWHGHIDNGVWSDWAPLQGNWTADFAATSSQYGIHVFARGTDNQLYTRLLTGGAWGPWTLLGGTPHSSPTAVATANGVYVFIRNSDDAIWFRTYNGGWGGWQNLHGNATGEPVAVADGNTVYVFVRGGDGRAWANRLVGSSWTGFTALNGSLDTSPTAVVDTSGVYVFVRGSDAALWYGRYVGSSWSGFQRLGGVVAASNALYA
jgi:hypothetical protein